MRGALPTVDGIGGVATFYRPLFMIKDAMDPDYVLLVERQGRKVRRIHIPTKRVTTFYYWTNRNTKPTKIVQDPNTGDLYIVLLKVLHAKEEIVRMNYQTKHISPAFGTVSVQDKYGDLWTDELLSNLLLVDNSSKLIFMDARDALLKITVADDLRSNNVKACRFVLHNTPINNPYGARKVPTIQISGNVMYYAYMLQWGYWQINKMENWAENFNYLIRLLHGRLEPEFVRDCPVTARDIRVGTF